MGVKRSRVTRRKRFSKKRYVKRRRVVKGGNVSRNGVLDFQKPTQTQYIARRSNRRARRSLGKFARKIQRVVFNELPLQTSIISQQTIVAAAFQQGVYQVAAMSLLSWYGSAHDQDIYQIFRTGNIQGTTTNTNITGQNNQFDGKLYMQSAHMDMYISNMNPSYTLYVNVYEYICMKDIDESSDSNLLTEVPTGYYNLGLGRASTSTLGITAFDTPEITGSVKILRMKRLQLLSGQSDVLSIHVNKPITIDGNDLSRPTGVIGQRFGKGGITRGFFLQMYQDPNYTVSMIPGNAVGINRVCRYTWKYIPGSYTSTSLQG